ncbi:ribonuclease III [Rhodoligotrophos appendicifer]|uniref:ribonuclease III n=1 Tax=Rhodoligotrophos appendicifer TaxID=987056 RepID=UPI003D1BB287
MARKLGHGFQSLTMLERAVTHSSFEAGRRRKEGDYERLEFLGDRVLGLIIAEELLRRFPDSSEGDLAPRFNALVRREACADVARELDLGKFIKLGTGEASTGGRNKTAILGNVCEAVIAAIYLDGGLESARHFINRNWAKRFEAAENGAKDCKSSLQEWAQARGLPPPVYRETARIGPDHAPLFEVEVALQGYDPAAGQGTSKRSAEQAAAELLINRLEAS